MNPRVETCQHCGAEHVCDRTRACAALGCENIFEPGKNQLYCSARCRNGENERKFIRQLGGKEAYSNYRSRMRYQRLNNEQAEV